MQKTPALAAFGALLACAAQPGTATATPFVDVASYVAVSGLADASGGTRPGDVVFLCDGIASPVCEVSLRARSGATAEYSYDATQTRTVTISNTTDRTLSALHLLTDGAAFAFPGRGIGVGDPSTQAASFSAATWASMPYLGVSDAGRCSTSAAQPLCAFTQWDSTGPNLYLLDPLPGGSSTSFTISTTLQAALHTPAAVAEPASAVLVGSALLGFGWLRRRARRA